jgi:hypothetical protein
VAKKFWYLGRKAHPLPEKFRALVGGRPARVTHPEGLVQEFKEWVRRTFRQGVTALPRDFGTGECQTRSDEQIRRCSPKQPIRSTRLPKVKS